MEIREIIEEVKKYPNCKVYPPSGLPVLEKSIYKLPEDVIEFYQQCGGMSLFIDQDYTVNVVTPEKFQLANPIIIGELCEEDITSKWFIVADDGNGDFLTIDLSKERRGRCYDSFWDSHGIVGECPIIAKTFTDLLIRLINNKGNRWYWLKDDFISLGDAYDNLYED